MTLSDQDWKDHIEMLMESKIARQGMLTVAPGSEDFNVQELSDNAWDIGIVSGVLQGVELTPTLLPNQKEAIADAIKAIKRIQERNHRLVKVKSASPTNHYKIN